MIDPITLFTAVYEILMLTYCSYVADEEPIPVSVIESCIPYLKISGASVCIGETLIEVQATEAEHTDLNVEKNVCDDDIDYDFTWNVHRADGKIYSFDPYEDENSWDFLMSLVNKFSPEQLSSVKIKTMYQKLLQAVTDDTLDDYWQWMLKDIVEYLETYANEIIG